MKKNVYIYICKQISSEPQMPEWTKCISAISKQEKFLKDQYQNAIPAIYRMSSLIWLFFTTDTYPPRMTDKKMFPKQFICNLRGLHFKLRFYIKSCIRYTKWTGGLLQYIILKSSVIRDE